MLWSDITLDGINVMVSHHTSHGTVPWNVFWITISPKTVYVVTLSLVCYANFCKPQTSCIACQLKWKDLLKTMYLILRTNSPMI